MNVYLNIKMENNSSGKKKKGVSWVVDKFLNLFLIACGVVVIWILLQVTSIATFKIPSDSMEPALLAGDNILVNKRFRKQAPITGILGIHHLIACNKIIVLFKTVSMNRAIIQ